MVHVLALGAEALRTVRRWLHVIVVVLDVHALVPLMRQLLVLDPMALRIDVLELIQAVDRLADDLVLCVYLRNLKLILFAVNLH